MIPFWLKLLRTHRSNGGYGLAFPFIAGAYQKMNECKEITLDAVRTIIASIASEAPYGSYISVTVCDRLNNPVFAESTFYKPSNTLSKVAHPDNEECKLFVVPTILDDESATVETLSAYLWNRYRNELQEGRFSFIKGQFIEFTDSNNQLILTAYSLEEDEDA